MVRTLLLDRGVLRTDYKITRVGEYVLLPVHSQSANVLNADVLNLDLEKGQEHPPELASKMGQKHPPELASKMGQEPPPWLASRIGQGLQQGSGLGQELELELELELGLGLELELEQELEQELGLKLELVHHDMESLEKPPGDYRKLLPENLFSPGLHNKLPSSFDMVGDIIVLKLTDELIDFGLDIGMALLETHAGAKTVLLDKGVMGEFRVRDLTQLAGVQKTDTIHKEYGLRIHVDLAMAYFSPRLATEHRAVAQQVKLGEVVLDMFAGIGPFALHIEKEGKAGKVVALDINPAAIELLNMSMVGNGLHGIMPVIGDARSCLKNAPVFDRVIMNLPHGAYSFIDIGLELLKPGGVLHYHAIVEDQSIGADQVIYVARDSGKRAVVLDVREVRSYSPTLGHYSFDIVVD